MYVAIFSYFAWYMYYFNYVNFELLQRCHFVLVWWYFSGSLLHLLCFIAVDVAPSSLVNDVTVTQDTPPVDADNSVGSEQQASVVDLSDIDIVHKSDLDTSVQNETRDEDASQQAVINVERSSQSLIELQQQQQQQNHVVQDGGEHADDANGIFHDAQDDGNFHQQFSPQFNDNDTPEADDVIDTNDEFIEASQDLDDNDDDDVNIGDDLATEGAIKISCCVRRRAIVIMFRFYNSCSQSR